MDLPVGCGTGLGQDLPKGTPVTIVKHRGFAIAAALRGKPRLRILARKETS